MQPILIICLKALGQIPVWCCLLQHWPTWNGGRKKIRVIFWWEDKPAISKETAEIPTSWGNAISRCCLTSIWFPVIKIRWSCSYVFLIMGISIPREIVCIETGPWASSNVCWMIMVWYVFCVIWWHGSYIQAWRLMMALRLFWSHDICIYHYV